MQIYRSSKTNLLKTGAMLLVLLLVFGYSVPKAAGLWAGNIARSSDPLLFGLNLNTTVPAIFLTLVALTSLLVSWYLALELLTKITVDDSGLIVSAPGLQRNYRWSELSSDPNQPEVQFRLKTPASFSFRERWFYPHRPANYLYLPASLENRPALIAQVEERLSRSV